MLICHIAIVLYRKEAFLSMYVDGGEVTVMSGSDPDVLKK